VALSEQQWGHGQPGPPSYGPGGHGTPQWPGPYQRTNGKAVASLITGVASLVLSLCCVGLAGLVAVVLGFRARREIAASNGQQVGSGMALGGIVTGALAALVSLTLMVFLVAALATGGAEYYVDTEPADEMSTRL